MESIPEGYSPILVVDDDTALLVSMEAVILSCGLPKPVLLSNSLRVKDVIERHRFHVALLDVIMPYFNGLEVLRQIQNIQPQIQCVMITASDDPAKEAEARRAGAFDYLVKPVNMDTLKKVIVAAFEKSMEENMRRIIVNKRDNGKISKRKGTIIE